MNFNHIDSFYLEVLFPTRKRERQVLAILLVLTMGWAKSLTEFCADTEEGTKLANTTLVLDMLSLDIPHCLDVISENQIEFSCT